MLSKKMAFSLMGLITLLAFAFVADDAFSAKKPFEIKIAGRTTATYVALTDDNSTTDVDEAEATVDLTIESAHAIPTLTLIALTDPTTVALNVKVTAIDRNGFVIVPAEDERYYSNGPSESCC